MPVFSFGENDLYDQVSNPHGSALRQWQTKMKDLMGFAPPLFHGRGIFQYSHLAFFLTGDPFTLSVSTVGAF